MKTKVILIIIFFFTAALDTAASDVSFQRLWSALKANPRRGPVFERVYNTYSDSDNIDSLIEKCKQLTENNPKESKYWLLLGLVLVENATKISDNKEEADVLLVKAATAFKEAESLNSDNALVLFYLGEVYFKQQKYAEAATVLERSLEKKPSKSDVVPVLLLLGRVYLRLDENDKTELVWKKAETLFPDDLDITTQIAEILADEKRAESASQRLEMVYAKNRSPVIATKLVKLYIAANQTEKALVLNPKLLFSNLFQYEKKYNESGQTKKFIELLDTISNNNPELVVKNSYQLSHYFSEWNQDERLENASRKLYDKLWNLENISDSQRKELRENFKRSMIGK